MFALRWLVLLGLLTRLLAVSEQVRAPQFIALRSPLTTLVEMPQVTSGSRHLRATVVVPSNAPSDLGIGVYAQDRDGNWYQRALPGVFASGRHDLDVDLANESPLPAEPARCSWSAEAASVTQRTGIYFWSAQRSQAQIRIVSAVVTPVAPGPWTRAQRLLDMMLPGLASDGRMHVRTGERWTLETRPEPWPDNPYDQRKFRLDARITTPDGRLLLLPGFCWQPMKHADRGDSEIVTPDGPARFALRFRPAQPGVYRISLVAVWDDGTEQSSVLPDLVVEGEARADYVRVDPNDPRFFSVGGKWWWPVGLNMNSTYDRRSKEVNATKLTTARGSLVYDVMLERMATAGVNATEIWMSSWNMALEWRADWPGYQGIGRYAQGNAWRLDQVLDRAWACGIRVNLVINNHGQASPHADREWKDNPYNRRNGGPLAEPIELFDHPAALAGQERLRRYLVARYADHPAILAWKLWSEVDLTAARGQLVPRWHEHAAARWHALDIYDHPVTTHWAGDFRRVHAQVAELPEIDLLCIDAYRHAGPDGTWRLLADILSDSTQYPNRGLSRYKKPCLVTEFGAGSGVSPAGCREVDHRTGAWAALVTGHAGAPMLWWWEWVDQGDRWQPFTAIRRFILGEDLRGRAARCAELAAGSSAGPLWCRAWVRPSRLLAYMQVPGWGAMGGVPPQISDGWLDLGSQIKPGTIHIEWWNCDDGVIIGRETVHHEGNSLRVSCPEFSGHIACKLWRDE